MLLKTKIFLVLFAIFLTTNVHGSEENEWQTMQSEGSKTPPKKVTPHRSPFSDSSGIQIDLAKGKILMSKLHFVSNADVPTPESEKLLKDLATLLNKKPELSLRIEGYSDSVGSDKKNLEMSQKRADRAKEILVKNGVFASRLEAVGLGDIYPVASDVTPEGQEKNRRVEFMIVNGQTPETTPTTLPTTVPETQTGSTVPAESVPPTQPVAPPIVPSVPVTPETQIQPVTPPTITIPPPAPITNPTLPGQVPAAPTTLPPPPIPVTPRPLIIVPNYSTNH